MKVVVSVRKRLLAASVCTLPMLAGHAFAEQAAGSSNSSSDGSRLSEVVVTSQRKSENLVAVAASLEAHSGAQLKAAGLNNISDLQFTTPGYTSAEGYGETEVYIRGVGNSVFVGADPSVGTYIDDIPRVFGSFVSAFTNVERVEVLKGAQGGLYGRNATGGVVNIFSRQPSTARYTADASVTYGSKDTLDIRAFINIPINDKIALSISGERDTHGPYTRNIAVKDPYSAANFKGNAYLPDGPGGSYVSNTPAQTAAFFNSPIDPSPLNDENLWTIEAKVLFKPTDNLKDTLALDYTRKHDNQGLQEHNLTPEAGVTNVLEPLFGAFGVSFVPTPGLIRATDGPFTGAKSVPTQLDIKDWGISNTAVVSLDGVDVTAIGSYRKHKPNEVDELGNLTVPIIGTNPYRAGWSAYAELRAVSTGAGPFHWLTGLTYLHEHYEENILTELLPPFQGLGGPLVSSIQDQDNYSVYAQVGYDITSKLSLTVSGRFIEEDNYVIFTSPVASSSSAEQTFLPSADLSYKVAGGGNVYARFAEGFKGGGINPAVSPVAFADAGGGTTGSTFSPEHVKTYEIGYRSTLFEHKVQVTAAAYYNDYTNLQVADGGSAAHPEIIFAIVNAGSARTYGVEGSVTWKVAQPITVGVNAGYLNAKYKQFSVDDPILAEVQLSGHQMIFAPSEQLSFTGALDQPIGDKFRVVGNVLASYTSRTLFQEAPFGTTFPNADQAPFWLVNLRLGVRTADDKYGIAVFVNNVFNQAYNTEGGTSTATGTTDIWGDPRIIGVELSGKF